MNKAVYYDEVHLNGAVHVDEAVCVWRRRRRQCACIQIMPKIDREIDHDVDHDIDPIVKK